MTNRDFYKAIESLLQEEAKVETVSLEQFLSALWFHGSRRKAEPALSLAEFLALLVDSFTPVETRIPDAPIDETKPGFAGWDSTIRRQIHDLRAMDANGQLRDKQRYFGIQSPGGQRWFNFDPCGYLECATAGSLGGWQEGDETGRQYVPGQVAVTDERGETTCCDPRALSQPPKEIARLSWDQMKDFLWCGQQYE